jgi:hypothetical protein
MAGVYTPIDPVWNIQRPVCAECREIVGSDSFCLTGALEHEELGEDGDGFEKDGEGP